MPKGKTKPILCTAFTVCFIAFVFHNSMFPGPQSSMQSQFVMHFVNQFLAHLHVQFSFSELFIRKAGHVTEYFVLGLLMTATIRSYHWGKKETVFAELFFLLLVPVFDEAIQIITPERGSSVLDVLLDFTSGVFAMLLFTLVAFVKTRKSRVTLKNTKRYL